MNWKLSRRWLCYREITAFTGEALPAGARQRPEFRVDERRRAPESGMFQQPESTSTSLAASPAPVPAPPDGPAPGPGEGASHAESTQRVPRWLERLELVLRVMLVMYIGLIVCYAPWWPFFWDKNPLFMQFPALGAIAAHGAVRGLVSGLGLLNLWIAFQDVIHYKER